LVDVGRANGSVTGTFKEVVNIIGMVGAGKGREIVSGSSDGSSVVGSS
jgi:hypothetical protein